tara:strand:+ start:85 stop:255 length:171 start_codon:yes stop_codon:yes gene_type:complete
MMAIKRYWVELDHFGGIETIEHPQGEWVKYEDYEAEMANIKRAWRTIDEYLEGNLP